MQLLPALPPLPSLQSSVLLLLLFHALPPSVICSTPLTGGNDDSSAAGLVCRVPQPLGMESGDIADGQLSASSTFDWEMLGPQNGRIRTDRGGGAWCPLEQVDRHSHEFIQVDLDALFEIWALEVQGRFAGGTGREYTEWIVLDYRRADAGNWIRYQHDAVILPGDWQQDNKTGGQSQRLNSQQLLRANQDEQGTELIALVPPVTAKSVRIVPFSFQLRTVCLRIELYGCRTEEDREEGAPEEQQNGNGADQNQWTAVGIALSRPLAVLLLASLVLLPLLLLFLWLLFRRLLLPLVRSRLCTSPALFACSSSTSPLRPSSSWQNVLLPLDQSANGISAKLYSPSFCHFDSVSVGWPSLIRSGVHNPPHQQSTWNNGLGAEVEQQTIGRSTPAVILRSRTTANAAGRQTAANGIPRKNAFPIGPVQMAHSRSQPETLLSAAVVSLSGHKPANGRAPVKPIPKPRSVTLQQFHSVQTPK